MSGTAWIKASPLRCTPTTVTSFFLRLPLKISGRPVKIVKFATNVTEEKLRSNEFSAKVDAIDRSLATIEFDLDGKVISANENFLRTIGYSLREIVGQHHSMFCSPDYIRSAEYRDFWMKLNAGQFYSGRFRRVGKYDRDIWIQATYNPIFDLTGNPVRIVKYAFDVTEQVQMCLAIPPHATDATSSLRAAIIPKVCAERDFGSMNCIPSIARRCRKFQRRAGSLPRPSCPARRSA